MIKICKVLDKMYEEIEKKEIDRISLMESIEEIRELSLTDRLTGLRNRLHGDEILRRFSEENVFAFFMYDVAGLKYLNDEFSRTVGDLAIIEAARFLRDKTRSYDLLFKYGEFSDEFGMLFPGMSEIEAERFRRRIIWDLSDVKIEFQHGKENVELPLGLHVGYGVRQYGKSIEQVIEEANKMMNGTKSS